MLISDLSSDVCSSDLCRTDALVNGSFTLPQSHVLAALRLVIGLRGLQLGAHLLDLSHERCHGIVWGVTFDTQRQHLFGRELTARTRRSEEHTSELQSLMRISYAVFCLKKKKNKRNNITST